MFPIVPRQSHRSCLRKSDMGIVRHHSWLLQIIVSATFLGTPRACSGHVRSLLTAPYSPDHSRSYTFLHMCMAWLRKQLCELHSLVTCVSCPRFRLQNLPVIATSFFKWRIAVRLSVSVYLFTHEKYWLSANIPKIIVIPTLSATLPCRPTSVTFVVLRRS